MGRLCPLATGAVEILHDATGEAFRSVTPQDCVGYFRHCGDATIKLPPL